MSFAIDGKTAIVTGAAHGVGLAVSRAFVAAGARVVMVDIDEEALEQRAADLAAETGFAAENGPVRIFAGDLREKLTITNMLALTYDAFGGVDILVNAARQVMPTDPLSPDDRSLDDLLQQNLMSTYRMCQAVAKKMIKLKGADEGGGCIGSIVNLSSIAARRTHPGLLAYSVTSAAVEQMTRSLAVALAAKRIRVNGVACGSVQSSGLISLINEDDEARDEVVTHTPLARIASPAEVADAVQYLASDGAGFVTGQIITVDGGRTLIDPASIGIH